MWEADQGTTVHYIFTRVYHYRTGWLALRPEQPFCNDKIGIFGVLQAKVSGAKVSGLKGLTYLDKEKDPSNPIKAEETR